MVGAAVGAAAALAEAAVSQAGQSVPARRSDPESSDELQQVTEPSRPVKQVSIFEPPLFPFAAACDLIPVQEVARE